MSDAAAARTGTPGHGWLRPVRTPVLATFALVALALIGGVLLILDTLRSEQAQRSAAQRNLAILSALRDIGRDAIAAENAQRGYFITLDRARLAPYQQARYRLDGALAQLDKAIGQATDPRVIDLATQIHLLDRRIFDGLDRAVARAAAGDMAGSEQQMLSGEGPDAPTQLQKALADLEAIQRDSMAQADQLASRSEAQVRPLLIGLLAVIVLTLYLGMRLAVRTAEAEAQAAQAEALAEAHARADLLARELNHRVKNMFAVVLAIVQMSGRDVPEAKPVILRIHARVQALLRSHDVTQGVGGAGRGGLREMVDTVLAPHLDATRACTVDGPEVALPASGAMSLGLVLHELATNAVKYGAWAEPGGRLAVRWEWIDQSARRLGFTWREFCSQPVAAPGEKLGFGSRLLEGAVRQLHGTFTREFHEDGLELRLELVLES